MSEPYVYQPVSDEEIVNLARALVGGQVFTSHHIPMDDQWSQTVQFVWLPIGLGGLSEAMIDEFNKHKVVFYEYLDKAGPRSVNGYPSFFSVRFISWEQFKQALDKSRSALEALTS